MADFREQFDRVINLVVMGNAHLTLWKGLSDRLRGDPKQLVSNVAPTFFGMTLESHLSTAFLYAAKIFDGHRDSLNIEYVLRRAEAERRSLPQNAVKPLEESLLAAKNKMPELKSALEAVRTRRDKVLAHLDKEVVSKPSQVAQDSEITVSELQKIFDYAWEILNGVSAFYWSFSFSHELLDIDDYEGVLDWVEKGKKRQLEEYEANYGSGKC
jgi:hypothetical protein